MVPIGRGSRADLTASPGFNTGMPIELEISGRYLKIPAVNWPYAFCTYISPIMLVRGLSIYRLNFTRAFCILSEPTTRVFVIGFAFVS